MKAKIFTLVLLLLAFFGYGQNYWSKLNVLPKAELNARNDRPSRFAVYRVNLEKIKADLSTASKSPVGTQNKTIVFPASDGTFRKYAVKEASVMEAELQSKYPELRSYMGYELGNNQHSIRFSVTPSQGISVMYFDADEVSYMDSFTKDNTTYMLYKRSDMTAESPLFECKIKGMQDELKNTKLKTPLVADGLLRTYRLALAATAEYTAYHGGTVQQALSAMVTAMTRVNGIYEKSVSLTMVLVGNTDQLIYTSAATDPYTNNDGEKMLEENIKNINTVIGATNYDIGHVFSTGGGGIAYLASVCTKNKAGGVTGLSMPVNEPFYIDYVAHEMGHQYGANHTFSATTGNCDGNENEATAFEPGSGSTIMAYAGICGNNNNVQRASDPYFHSASIAEIYNVIRRTSDCSVKSSNNNTAPLADAGLVYRIPHSTAFVLTGIGSDPDGDEITYLWEQINNSKNVQPPLSTATAGPVYRSRPPSKSASRYFPTMSAVLANNLTPKWEVTPSVARTLNFSLLVNDNRATGNQSARSLTEVIVVETGPFSVTSQPANIQYKGAESVTVSWSLAGTNEAPINVSRVKILLSTNKGDTFDVVLAESVPNTGSAIVNLPNEDIAEARIMVKAIDNIFFALNPAFFSVKKSNLATLEVDSGKVKIYPNPARNEITVSSPVSEAVKFSIYDASGRAVKTANVRPQQKINISELSVGNYILTLELKNGEKITEKLLIRK